MIRLALSCVACVAVIFSAGAGLSDPPAEDFLSGLEDEIREFVHARSGVPRGALSVPPLGDFRPPEGVGPVEVRLSANPRTSASRHTPVTVTLLADDREIKRGVVRVGAPASRRARPSRRKEGSHLVASRALEARAPIGPDDIQVASGPPPRGAIGDTSRIVGRQTTRRIAAGTPWRERLVKSVPAIRRGDLVRLRVERGPLLIEGIGKAREDAAAGDRVRILNVESRREVVGVVEGDGVVRVGF